MSRHNVFLSLSRPQAEYLLDVIEADIKNTALDPDEATTAEAALRKILRAVSRVNERVNCGPDCKCRAHRTRDADSEPSTGSRSAAGAVPGVVGPDEDGESL